MLKIAMMLNFFSNSTAKAKYYVDDQKSSEIGLKMSRCKNAILDTIYDALYAIIA